MKTFRTLPLMFATALCSLAAPSDALADPDTSPFSDRGVVKLNNTGLDKINLNSCNLALVNKAGSQWYRYVFNAAAVGNELTPGGGVSCNSGTCIKRYKSSSSSGPWQQLPKISALSNASDAGYGIHCNKTTTGDNEDYEWQFWSTNFPTNPFVPLTDSSPASHVAHTFANWPAEWMGICRVVYLGGTYVGTLREVYDNDFMVWNENQGRFVLQNTPLSQMQNRNACVVRLPGGGIKRFHNFQGLLGDIPDNKWKNPTSSGNPPSHSFVAGKLDTGNVFACVERKTYYSAGSNPVYLGTKRAVGWWQAGDDECHVPLYGGSNINGTVTNTAFTILTK